jgi:hypothetical protein
VAFPALGLTIHPSAPSSAYLGWAHLLRGHSCLWMGLIVACVPVIVGAWSVRGAIPVRSRWTCAALGAGAGSLGGLVLHLHCPIADGPHIGVIHGGVVAVAAVLAAVLAPRVANRPLR